MALRIIADSTADIADRYKDDVLRVPLTLYFGETPYIDGVTIDKETFYNRLVETDELPRTSQASPADFEKLYREVTAQGDSALVITLSSKLSGTYQSACIAAADYPNIRVIDSLNAATGSGILVEYAADCARAGMTLGELAEHLDKKKKDICLVALLDTLEYLKKGGRISRTAAFAGDLLNIKPVITIDNGEVSLIGKARGSRKGNNFLNQKVDEYGLDFTKPLLLGYSGLSDALLQKYIDDSRALWEGQTDTLDTVRVSSVIGTHAGPGAIVVSFFRRHG